MSISEITPPSNLFPSRLKSARELRGMSQQALAIATGLPATSISHFESGSRKPSFDNLRLLSDKLNVSADFLLGRAITPEQTAVPDQLARHASKLTTADLKLAEGFLALLADKDKDKDKDKERRS
ncbi:helix-turn-helix domain-containing protein [Rhodoferax sp. BAB1]|uniref:helix-turn-helix domain-containing protein n=1 Tax=Rhodoferax sp. BAB1 TaxID=2741720 RepID=UPI0015766B3B|nr:helix-turn-helix transcriptional regulator [Rhodoferax sp. BAB1]QKO20908.1 helix-turn-helix transcriptional regulator [Rhodoferax sp. BAB1]